MTAARIRKLMLGVAALALLAGIVIAILTAPGSNEEAPSTPSARASAIRPGEGSDDLAIAARYLDLSTTQLRSELNANSTLAEIADATAGRSSSGLLHALLAAKLAHLDRALSAGRLTRAARANKLARLSRRVSKEIHRHEGISVGPIDRATAALYLGLTVGEIRATLRSGRSLAQTASSTRGRSAAGLIDALIHAKTAALAAAVRAGKLTPAAQRASIATLPRRVSAEVYFRRSAAP
jgi:hypothetical protein